MDYKIDPPEVEGEDYEAAKAEVYAYLEDCADDWIMGDHENTRSYFESWIDARVGEPDMECVFECARMDREAIINELKERIDAKLG